MSVAKNFSIMMIVFALLLSNAYADNLVQNTGNAKKINLVSGKSAILNTTKSISRVSIANPDIASNMVLSPRELYITGKAAGSTNLILWHRNKVANIYEIVVNYDIGLLKDRIMELLPNENELNIMATNDSITLSGKASSSAALAQAVSLAEAYAPKGKVKNMAEVGGVHQVMLEVRIAEMQKSIGRDMGINMSGVDNNGFGITSLGGFAGLGDSIAAGEPIALAASSAVNALFHFSTGVIDWTAFMDIMQGEGLAKVLAKPTLIALSGQTAKFLAGGEYPIPTSGGSGGSNVDYKEYGVRLSFTPTVVNPDKISMVVAPEVSELDFSVAARVEGFVVPGLSTRRTSTTIELGNGQSFVIAGLLKDVARSQYSKYPILGDIPILGALFRSRKFQRNETELVVIVTPHLVKPVNADKQPLPTDFYIEPNATEFYLGNSIEGSPAANTKKDNSNFGHAMPKN